ncbi:aminotransferase [Desulfosarcina ovata subsp. sediminis]|uniref:Aminotransferase n=1 Tax=Desulfosarcina ovata subsp. sediminis TaxID=885957 RepID=A0A5K7ZTY6_9BACT|nr:aminotransferase class V-fold PLP-dependent enzyme [Desulfosarcina ovata]BBO83685.1 aminotransferase [Desulfosarcina ovata subsp. sediminis]
MKTYPIPMVPGPVVVPDAIRKVYLEAYGSGDLEPEFVELYTRTQRRLKTIFNTRDDIVIMTGEGMLALWSALKSCLVPGDRVLTVATGVFGYGIGEMAQSLGADVKTVGFSYDETINDMSRIEAAIAEFKPRMITAVHCETPSGTLNPLEELGRLKNAYQIPLFYVDTVAGAGGVPVLADDWHIDLCLGGAQKCLSAPPEMSFLSVSPKAWEIIDAVGYVGYDALNPFRQAVENRYFPYTPSWQGVAALYVAAGLLLDEGLENSFNRHDRVARHCRQRLVEMGIDLFPAAGAVPSPTVTAAKIPQGLTWETWDRRLRDAGLVVAGSYGPLAGKVFRLGHMGTQADPDLVDQALDVIAGAL